MRALLLLHDTDAPGCLAACRKSLEKAGIPTDTLDFRSGGANPARALNAAVRSPASPGAPNASALAS